ncbi:MAG TPA: TolC family protein [Abditibacteriaceae bacterium]
MKTQNPTLWLALTAALPLGLAVTTPALAQDSAQTQENPTQNAAANAAGNAGVAAANTAGAASAAVAPSAGLPPEVPQSTEITPPALPAPPAPSVVAQSRLGDSLVKAGEASEPISLEEAIIFTLQNSPQRAATRAALAASQARVGTARAQGGPQVGLSAGTGLDGNFGRQGGNGNNNNNGGVGGNGGGGNSTPGRFNDSSNIGVSATIPIYNGGSTRAATRVARANAEAAASQTVQVEQDLVLNATNAYLQVLRADQLLQVEDSNLAVSRERQRVATVRYEAGASARLDVYRANTTLAEAQQRRIIAGNNSGQARANLNTLMGRLPTQPLRVEPITQLTLQIPLPTEMAPDARGGGKSLSMTELYALAVASRPQGGQASAQVRAADAAVDVARAQRKPSIGASISGFLRNPASFLGQFAVSLGLSVAQNLFDSGRSRSQIEEARALALQARASYDAQVLGVANEIETALLSLDSASGRLASAEAAVSEARAALAAAQLGYEAGARTALDVTDAQAALLTTETNAVNARFDVAASQAELSAAVGLLTTEGQNAYRLALQQEKTNTRTPESRQIEADNLERRRLLGLK